MDLRRMILPLLLLAITSLHGTGALPTEHHIERTPLEKDLTARIGSDNYGEVTTVLAKGVLWELPAGEIAPGTSSSAMHKLPDVICQEEGFQFVPGSCEEFIYCKDLSSDGLEDWYIFWFTCEDGKYFDREQKKCQSKDLASGHQRCQSDITAMQEQSNLEGNLQEEELKEKSDMNTFGIVENLTSTTPDTTAKLSKDELLISYSGSGNLVPLTSFSTYSNDDNGHAAIEFQTRPLLFNRARRSANPMEIKSDVIAQSATQTCVDVKNIDRYVKHIESKEPVRFSSSSEEVFASIIKQYNQNLRVAQVDSKDWDKSSGILASVKKTFQLVKEFEPKFKNRFESMKKKVAVVLKKDKIDIEKIKEEMDNVTNELKEIEELLDMSVNMKVNSFILKSMQEDLKNKRREHRHLTIEYRNAEKETEFQELAEILAFVRDNSIEIQSNTLNTRMKMEQFREVIMQDSTRFNKAYGKAEKGLQTLTEQENNNKNELRRLENQKKILERQIADKENLIANLQKQRERDEVVLRREMAWLRGKQEAAQRKKNIGGGLLVIPVVGWIAGGILLGQGVSEKRDAVRRLEATIQEYKYKQNNYEDQLRSLNSMVTALGNDIDNARSRTQKIEREIPSLQAVRESLRLLQTDVNSIVPFISKAISSLKKLKEIFQETEESLNSIIKEASNAHTRAQKKMVSYFMYHEIDETIKKHWENAKEKIIDVGKCVVGNT